MFNPLTSITDFNTRIRETPCDDVFFRNRLSIPIIGLVVHVWKRHYLLADLKETALTDVPTANFDSKLKVICHFDTHSIQLAKWAIAIPLILGIALAFFAPPVGIALASVGLIHLGYVIFCITQDWHLSRQQRAVAGTTA